MKINKALLKKVRDYILAKPEGYDQNVWGVFRDEVRCGTACCIAGTALMLEDPREYFALVREDDDKEIKYRGLNLLGFTEDDNLIGPADDWIGGYASKYEKADNRGDKERAKVAASRIGYFLRTGK